jgi:hypothetical protein
MATLFSDILNGMATLAALVLRRRLALTAIRAVAVRTIAGLGVIVTLGASRATATCGDWLAHPSKAAAAAAPAGAAETQVDEPKARSTNATSRQAPSRPCQGPFCGKAPSTPAAPTPAPIPTLTDQTLAVLALHGADGDPAETFSCLTLGDADPLAGFGRRIDHPPRA